MSTTTLAVALSAGVLAAVNPCGFAMLPAYVSLLVTGDTGAGRTPTWSARVLRAVALTAAMTLGFATTFGAFGLLAAPAADWIAARLPWLTVIIGVVLAGLGVWQLSGRQLPSPVAKPGSAPELSRRIWPMFTFGVSFAIASLGCTIGPFLAVVVTSFAAASWLSGAGLFLAYAAGMALVIGTVSVAVATAQQTMIGWMRRTAKVISRVAGALMTAAGAYVAWYGWYELRVLKGTIAGDPVIDGAASVQTWLASAADAIGPAGFALALACFAIAIGFWRRLSKSSR